MEGITEIAGMVVLAGALLSIVSLIQRFRRESGVERQQIRWLLFLAAFLHRDGKLERIPQTADTTVLVFFGLHFRLNDPSAPFVITGTWDFRSFSDAGTAWLATND